MPVYKDKIPVFLLLLLGTLLLSWAAFYNGFPLIYSDTSTYLESGFVLETPLDRPITYGLLMRIFSLNGLLVWGIVFAQTFILVSLIYLTIRSVSTTRKNAVRNAAMAILVLAFVSGLPWLSAELIADIFTPICLLSFYLVMFAKHTAKMKVLLYFILLISLACHISNVMIVLAITVCVILISFIRKRKGKLVLVARRDLILVPLFCILALSTMGSSISKSRHVFMMGHLVETGILTAYLDDHCATENISLCKYRDRIPPGAETFIWNSDGDSVLILTGGWMGSKEEYSKIISETFSTGKYLEMHLAAAVTGTLRQLYTIRVGEGMGMYDTTMMVSQRLKKYFPGEYPQYVNSRQSHDEMAAFPIADPLNKIATALALLVIVFWFFVGRNKSTYKVQLSALSLTLIAAYILNCAICATLATVANRFGARLSWMAILLAVLLIADMLSAYKESRDPR
ncbi:MAG TPA: hypothetical protein VK826_09025 [Bacteroidia bacterium]|nr:hypothetical protein [Bacteroidia bacterium]